MKVAIVGATGQTGGIIVNALLSQADEIQVVALTRPASLQKPAVLELQKRGVQIVKLDLAGPEEEIAKALYEVDVVISGIYGGSVMDEIPLVNAAKSAGVQRYLPCFFATVAPPTGALDLREMKEEVLNHIKMVKLPYTVVDIGWWYQINVPRLPSGRVDYAIPEFAESIWGDGNAPIGLTDVRDIGNYVARIITDPRTLNKMVFAYNEVHTHNQIWDLLEQLSGERLLRKYVKAEDLLTQIEEAKKKNPPPDSLEFVTLTLLQYRYSCGVRRDNTPENAEYLGYLLAKDLYPDFKGIRLETYIHEALNGKAEKVYKHLEVEYK